MSSSALSSISDVPVTAVLLSGFVSSHLWVTEETLFHQLKGPGVVAQWPTSTPRSAGSVWALWGRKMGLKVILVWLCFWVPQEDVSICGCVCVSVGWHRWLWSEDVINTLGRGISVQEWAPCFSGEVTGKKAWSDWRRNKHTQTRRQILPANICHASHNFPPSFAEWPAPQFSIFWSDLQVYSPQPARKETLGAFCFVHRDGEEIRVSVPPPHHPVCVFFLQRCCCYVRYELWPCGALGNSSDCLTLLLWWCRNPLDLASVWLSWEPLFSIFLCPGRQGMHDCVWGVRACVCVCVSPRVSFLWLCLCVCVGISWTWGTRNRES